AAETKALRDQINVVKAEAAKIKPVMTPIMRELPANRARKTNILIRGNFLDKGAEVKPGAPAIFPPVKEQANRLDFAKWLLSPDNPLTARVTVNRFWEQVFGREIGRASCRVRMKSEEVEGA